MRILVVGGTQFIGRHVVDHLLARGDEVTLFHRGLTNPDLFPEADHRLGDRNVDLAALLRGEWDATFDPSAYVPRQVRALASALGGRGGRYVHVSSVSAYAEVTTPGGSEELALAELDDRETEVVDETTYGALKALCELASHDAFGEGSDHPWPPVPVSIVRPTYVVGPYDHTGRFTWWMKRLARGGRVLAPGPAESPFQVIDARDLADFVVRLLHGEAAGTFHTVSPAPPCSFADFLRTAAAEVAPAGTELVWVEADALVRAGVTDSDLPLWAPAESDWYFSALDPSRAFAAGLRPRPLAQTIRELHEHELRAPTPVRGPIGLDPARESELLRGTLTSPG